MRRIETLTDLVETFPSRSGTALIYHNGFRTFRYSYQELYELVRACAGYYERRGIRAGERVAVWGYARPEWVIAFLGAMYAGIVPVPIDIQATSATARAVFKHADVKLLVRAAARAVGAIDIPTIELEDLELLIANAPKGAPHAANPHDMAEIVYTSGTTGDPKGVALSHENLIANVRAVVEHLRVTKRDSIFTLLPLSHLFGQTCGMTAPLSAGMTIVIPNTLTAHSLFSTLARERVTIILVVPRMLQGIRSGIEAMLRDTRRGRLLSALPAPLRAFAIRRRFGRALRLFVSGGAALDRETARYFKRLKLPVIAGYGLTETSPVLTAEREGEGDGTSAGVPLISAEVRLAADGEIVARGPSVFRGYYRDTAKTAEAFSGGYFLTGDLGEFDTSGTLYIKGRKKETIVTAAGINVYPDDLEPVLNAIAGVKESCVVGLPREEGEEVHAVILPLRDELDLHTVMRKANEHLNSSQQIRSISRWRDSEFPKTSTMKIKRAQVRAALALASAAPMPDLLSTSKLKVLLGRVLGIAPETIADSALLYPDLKLDSIGRIEISSLITQEYFFEFDEDLIDQRTTVADLERLIATRARSAPRFPLPRWPHYRFMIAARFLGMELINANLSRLFFRVQVRGAKNLARLRGPVIFVANHVSYADHGAIFRALPWRFRYRLAAPAYAEFFFMPKDKPLLLRAWKRFAYYWSAATMAIFPTSQSFSSKRALEHAGALIDQGESLLIFPEAERTRTPRMLPFHKGAAILVKNLRVPVVPIGHRGLEYVYPRGAALPRFGTAVVTIGKPITFGTGSVEEITSALEREVERLRRAA